MSEIKYAQTRCAVQNCKITAFNKPPHVSLHQFPLSAEMRNKWFNILKSRCSSIDWNKSRICSKHFDNHYFDSQRKLRYNALPTMFPSTGALDGKKTYKPISQAKSPAPRTKLDRLLNTLTQSELHDDIQTTMQQLKMPDYLSSLINDDLKCQPNTPTETQLWLLIKKQEHLITRLMQGAVQNKKHIEVLQKNLEENRSKKKEMELAVENYKYISKCLQEKHATLEEQIKLLTAIEFRK